MTLYNDSNKTIKPVGDEGEILFDKVIGMFNKESMDSLYKVMADTGISKRNIELWKVIVALELYKGYYETIPKDIKEIRNDLLGITNEIKTNLLKTESNIEKLADQVETNSATLQMALNQFEEMTGKRIESAGKIAESTAQNVIQKTNKALNENLKVVNSLKAGTTPIKWIRFRNVFFMCLIVFIFGAITMFSISWRYHKNRADESIYLNEVNRDALRRLSEAGREISVVAITGDPKKKGQTQVYIKNAETVYKTQDNIGVIEFK